MKWGRRILAVILIIGMCLSMGVAAFAEEVWTEELTPEQEEAKKELERLYELPIQTNELTGWPEGPGTYGEAAIVMEVGTGAILYAKNIDAHYYPASITKILTTLVALENGKLDDKVTFSADSLSFLEWDDAAIGMKEGNVITLEQALYAVLLASANEVSYAVGESVGKNAGHDYSWFIEQMNTRCRELGGMNSHFVNPHGLHNDDHYTCARDMALISRELFKFPEAFTIMQSMQYEIKKSKTTEEHVFQQNHKMFYMDNPYYWEYVIGGKTGFTDQAHNTLITMTDNGDMQLVCVVLKTEGVNVYSDTRALCDYVYNNFKKVEVKNLEKFEEIDKILEQEGSGYVVLPEGVGFEKLDLEIIPDTESDGEADLVYSYEGNPVGIARAGLNSSYMEEEETEPEKKPEVKDSSKEKEEKKEEKSVKDKIMLAAAVGTLILLVIILIEYIIMSKRARKRKR